MHLLFHIFHSMPPFNTLYNAHINGVMHSLMLANFFKKIVGFVSPFQNDGQQFGQQFVD